MFCVSVADSLGQYIEHGYYSNQYKQKTLYPWTYPKQPPQKNDLMTVTMNNRACTAVHANFVLRHAARYTTVGVMRDFTKLHEKIKSSYGSQNYSFIDSWNNTYPEGKAESVTRAGEYEMEYLGIMYGNRLYGLLKSAFSVSGGFADKLMFAGTRSTRTQTSAKLFSGWLSEVISEINQKSSKVLIRDDVLRFWDNCRAYKDATSDKQEMSRFEHGTHFQGVIQNVANKLELNGTLTVGRYMGRMPEFRIRRLLPVDVQAGFTRRNGSGKDGQRSKAHKTAITTVCFKFFLYNCCCCCIVVLRPR